MARGSSERHKGIARTSGCPPVRRVWQPSPLTVKGRRESSEFVSLEVPEEVGWPGVQVHRPLREQLSKASAMSRGRVPHAPTASWSCALSSTRSGGALAAARRSPLTTRVVAGGITTVRSLMGLLQRGQEILSSWKTRQRRAAHASQAGSGPSAGALVSRRRRWSGVVSAGGVGTISLRQLWLEAKTPQ